MLKRLKQKRKKQRLNQRDYEFMHSLSSAILQVTPMRLRLVLYFWAFAVTMFLVWANFAQIDEIARGNGEIIPSGENQMVQNLEGGIVKEILVHEGQRVKKGQVLIKIENQKSETTLESTLIKIYALEAKVARLSAESKIKKFVVTRSLKRKIPASYLQNERSLYKVNMRKLKSKMNALNEQLQQRKQELQEAKEKAKYFKTSYEMISQEVEMTAPMVERGVRPKIDFLKLKREANELYEKYNTLSSSIPRLKSSIKEAKSKIKEEALLFKSDAKKQLNDVISELQTLKANSTAFKDQVHRTSVIAPMDGVVQTLFVHTVGGVIKPGADIVEIVPSDQVLLVEVKIKPADIAFIYFGQKAIVKFSAYDFSIYGGLEGEVVLISADTIKDKKDNTFYTVRIKTTKNYIGSEKKPLKIIPGMTVSVDILTGKKSVLDYILKPILKTKQYSFTER